MRRPPLFAPIQSPLAPQLSMLVFGSTHAPLQATRPSGHGWQTPPQQPVPLPQAIPASEPVQLALAPQC